MNIISKSKDGMRCMAVHNGETIHLKQEKGQWMRLINYRHEVGSTRAIGGIQVPFAPQEKA